MGERLRSGFVVNVGGVNFFAAPAFESAIVTQALLDEPVKVVDQQGKWFRIRPLLRGILTTVRSTRKLFDVQ